MKKGVLKNFTKFAGKHNFIKKETLAQVLSSEFCEISKNTFFAEHLWATVYNALINQLQKGYRYSLKIRPLSTTLETGCKKKSV